MQQNRLLHIPGLESCPGDGSLKILRDKSVLLCLILNVIFCHSALGDVIYSLLVLNFTCVSYVILEHLCVCRRCCQVHTPKSNQVP